MLYFQMVESVSELHVSIDELLLSAMTLCRYCLADDQHIVKARCQVVSNYLEKILYMLYILLWSLSIVSGGWLQ